MRASALSDEKVINVVNEFFIALEINVTCDGFPENEFPVLTYVKRFYETNWRFQFGFANCMVLDSDGKILLGSSVGKSLSKDPSDVESQFSPQRYLEFLVSSLERHKKTPPNPNFATDTKGLCLAAILSGNCFFDEGKRSILSQLSIKTLIMPLNKGD